jgi:NADPH2 dehydrogenase
VGAGQTIRRQGSLFSIGISISLNINDLSLKLPFRLQSVTCRSLAFSSFRERKKPSLAFPFKLPPYFHTTTLTMPGSSRLFEPLRIGNFEVSNRMVMAPLTRYRADDSHTPLPFVADYYAQRASYPGTLLVTEATFIAPRAGGYANVPGIYTDAQIKAWKKVTDAVHAKKSFIFLQLWALGRTATLDVLKAELGEDTKLAGASAIPLTGHPTPTPLTEEEILEYIELYKQAAKNAIAAGFDGVEIHEANGYLIDQFTQDVTNQRTDRWGGSVENRARFGIEVAKAVVGAIGPERTGLRISPYNNFQEMRMKDPVPQFSYLAEQLKKLNLAYLHVVESRVIAPSHDNRSEDTGSVDFILDIWGNTSPVLLAGGYNHENAYKAVDEKHKDRDVAIVFGRYFISNPDLVFRIKENIPFTPYDRSTFYLAKDPKGYTTFEFSKEWEAQAQAIAAKV